MLRFYVVYRAMVRAKIAAIRATQETAPAARARDHDDFLAHLALAEACARAAPPALVVTCGASGSGKSFAARALAGTGEWIRVRSDVERKRLVGLAAAERSGSGLGADLYAGSMTVRTYAQLAKAARIALDAGYPVVVDATFLSRRLRDAFRGLAAGLEVPFVVLVPQVSPATMRARVEARAAAGGDPSEATVEVLERQLADAEPLGARRIAVGRAVRRGARRRRAARSPPRSLRGWPAAPDPPVQRVAGAGAGVRAPRNASTCAAVVSPCWMRSPTDTPPR